VPNYTLNDGETVKNKLGANSHTDLELREVAYVAARQTEHSLDPRIPRTFDAAHLKAIHRQLFQDVYEWAGHTRDEKVRLSDGTIATEPRLSRSGSKPFASGNHIGDRLAELGNKLREANYFRGLPRAEFASRAAGVLAQVNEIHAFREGNGRSQRIFMQELAEEAGHSLDFRVVSRERMIQASIAAHEDRDIGPMRRMLDEISNPHRVAALTPAIAFLNSVKYPWNDRYVATLEPGHIENLTVAGVNGAHFMARTDTTILIGQRSDLPGPNGASGARVKVFPSRWPEPDDKQGPSAQSGPSFSP
jgi:cell filamentation protein